MKRTIYILTLFALALSSCSMKEEAFDQETNEGIFGTYQVSINAGPEDQTKAISIGGNTGNRLYTNWDNGDAVQVVNSTGDMVGTLTANQSAGNSAYAKLGGTLTGTFAVNDVVTLCYHTAEMDYTGQVGTLAGVSTNNSYLTATSTVQAVNVGSGTIQDAVGYLSMSDATFSHQQAYLDLTFMAEDGVTPLQITSLEIWTDGGKLVKTKALDGTTVYATEDSPLIITPAAPSTKFFLALRDENGAANNYHFKATVIGGYTFTYEGEKHLQYGHYYIGTKDMGLSGTLMVPLTFEAKTDGIDVSFRNDVFNVQYSIDGGLNWVTYDNNNPISLVHAGDKVMFRGNNNTYYGNGFYVTGSCYIYGNIMSLISSTEFTTAVTLTEEHVFDGLFITMPVENHPIFPINLPATTLSPFCYQNMFYGTAITSAPELPATNLATYCYSGMFGGCSQLTTAPSLSATTLADYCYLFMFQSCNRLTTAPELPATTGLREGCYQGMFDSSGLTSAPELLATTMKESCYKSMFASCEHLITAPYLPAETLAVACYENMFSSCTNLTSAPVVLPATEVCERSYKEMFYNCTSLQVAPNLLATTLANNCYEGMFSECTSLIKVPATLPATTLAVECYKEMFKRCEILTTAPALPATSLAESCYESMFKECDQLTATPVLPATELVSHCYDYMFSGCDNLTTVTCLATTNMGSGYTYDWLYDACYNNGTFYINSSFLDPADPDPWAKNSPHGIRSGLTIRRLLPGQFSISSTKKVSFAPGNLQAIAYDYGDYWFWEFATNQWDYLGDTHAEINGNSTVSEYVGSVEFFGWVGASSSWTDWVKYGISNSTSINSSTYGNVISEALKSDWGNTVGPGWRTLQQSEWDYLLKSRTASTIGGTANARYLKAQINDDSASPVNGVIIFPDMFTWTPSMGTAPTTCNTSDNNYTHSLSCDEWEATEEAGAVFLPAAGYRIGASVNYVNTNGFYWSSTSDTVSPNKSYGLYFTEASLSADNDADRYNGGSVRLVINVN